MRSDSRQIVKAIVGKMRARHRSRMTSIMHAREAATWVVKHLGVGEREPEPDGRWTAVCRGVVTDRGAVDVDVTLSDGAGLHLDVMNATPPGLGGGTKVMEALETYCRPLGVRLSLHALEGTERFYARFPWLAETPASSRNFVSSWAFIDARELADADLPVIAGWRDAAAEQYLVEEDWLTGLLGPAEHPGTHAVVGELDGLSIGVVLFQHIADDEAYIYMLMAPEFRQRGLGRLVVRRALAMSSVAICKADVEYDNEAAAMCLSAAGFTEHFSPEFNVRFFSWTRDGRPYQPRI